MNSGRKQYPYFEGCDFDVFDYEEDSKHTSECDCTFRGEEYGVPFKAEEEDYMFTKGKGSYISAVLRLSKNCDIPVSVPFRHMLKSHNQEGLYQLACDIHEQYRALLLEKAIQANPQEGPLFLHRSKILQGLKDRLAEKERMIYLNELGRDAEKTITVLLVHVGIEAIQNLAIMKKEWTSIKAIMNVKPVSVELPKEQKKGVRECGTDSLPFRT